MSSTQIPHLLAARMDRRMLPSHPPSCQQPPGEPEARSPWLFPAQPGYLLYLILRRPQAGQAAGETCRSRSTFTLLSYRWRRWHLSQCLTRVVTLSWPKTRRRVAAACSHAGSFPRLPQEDRTQQGQRQSGGEGISAPAAAPHKPGARFIPFIYTQGQKGFI